MDQAAQLDSGSSNPVTMDSAGGMPPPPRPPTGGTSAGYGQGGISLNSLLATGMNIEALKEPRGFIRILEFVLAIFAFATTTSHSTAVSFSVQCPPGEAVSQDVSFGYAYRLEKNTFTVASCNSTGDINTSMYGNMASSAEFYVFVGVMAFLYTLASVVGYVLFDEKYRSMDKIPMADFIITAVFALLWLISSSAWAQGVTDVKYYSNPDELFLRHIPACSVYIGHDGTAGLADCKNLSGGNFASLNVSLLFGFLNVFVWAGNIWFLFKETKWFFVKTAPPTVPPPTIEVTQRI